MSDPPRWQLNQSPYQQPSLPYPQHNYRPETNNNIYDQTLPPPQAIQQSTLLQLRPLQPNPYPAAGYPIYPYPRNINNNNASQLEESDGDKADNRRTRISRACDACRRKKIKCDTGGPGNTCKNCKSSKLECTFNDSAKKRGPPKGYIEVLENRLKRMERILGNLADEEDDKPPTTNEPSSSTTTKKRKALESKKKNDVDDMSQIKDENGQVTPNATTAAAETTTGALTENSNNNDNNVVEPSSLSTGMRTRYIGDMSPLPFLAQKINFEDARIASKIGIKIKRFGQSLVLYEKGERLNGKSANQILLEDLNMIKPGETIKGLNDWIYKVAGVDKTTSDSLMKM